MCVAVTAEGVDEGEDGGGDDDDDEYFDESTQPSLTLSSYHPERDLPLPPEQDETVDMERNGGGGGGEASLTSQTARRGSVGLVERR